MNKEEILELSRKENKNQDVYEQDVVINGNRYACIAAGVIATVFFIVQICYGRRNEFRNVCGCFLNAHGEFLVQVYQASQKA